VAKKKSKAQASSGRSEIVIDEDKGLRFNSEEALYKHFGPAIQVLEDELEGVWSKDDIPRSEFDDYDELLTQVLEEPEEIWEDDLTVEGTTFFNYLGAFEFNNETIYYVAVTYVADNTPTFVYMHFPSRRPEMLDHFRRGESLYNRAQKDVEQGAVEGDALSEGDELAVGLYKSMLKLRGENDIPESAFQDYVQYREETIEEPDEIWRSTEVKNSVLVSFIHEFMSAEGKEFHYVVVTAEDGNSGSHLLLFSFPTVDASLVERYRHGENLQAEEVVQESSH
jgi:phage-Barnase-EndoU-ColicinE5/D-RelE like nuclease2